MNIYEIYEKSEKNFDSLSPIEKNIYVLYDFQTIYEMEGFSHFFRTDRNQHIPCLMQFLKAIDAPNIQWVEKMVELIDREVPSWEADEIDAFLCEAKEEEIEDEDEIDSDDRDDWEYWGDQFYELVDEMWDRVDAYLASKGLGPLEWD
ncbi:MAG: hypothetical protein JSV88_23605 [Candidatus Aminicenantes bacterium]|nr:MAG: hypothetical protein JSV88_23605 [Candidatus Aminicenantes bacterium]